MDILFYLGILSAIIAKHWPVLRERLGWVVAVIVVEAVNHLFGWLKFGRMPSYHSYAAKAWGLLLAARTITLLTFDRGAWLLSVALVWGILCNAEIFMMTAILPEWAHDVRTLARAFSLRRQMLAQRELQAR